MIFFGIFGSDFAFSALSKVMFDALCIYLQTDAILPVNEVVGVGLLLLLLLLLLYVVVCF